MSRSIREAAHDCLQNLQNALNRHSHPGPPGQRSWVQRRIVDFNTWATFSGVFRDGKYGLDAKLCLRPDLQLGLISLLQVFDSLLSPMVEKSGACRTHEIEEKFSEIVSTTVYLRKSLANTGLWPDADSAQIATGVLKGGKPHFSQPFLGSTQEMPESVPIKNQRHIIQSLRNRLDKASFMRDRLFAQVTERQMANAESQHIWPPPKTNQFPPVPLLGPQDSSFSCQFCCRELPAFFSDAHAWREHFLQDLSPYTCVLPNCPQPDSVYGTQRDWEAHMKSVAHDGFEGRSWCCKVCLTEFKSMDHLLRHLRVTHVNAGMNDADAESPAEFESCIKLDLNHLQVCFLCDEDLTGVPILDHIASCMEVFTLKSLKIQEMTPPTISIQIEEVDISGPTIPLSPSYLSSDRGHLLEPPIFAEQSGRRARSLPEHSAGILEFRQSSKRRSMIERNDYELTQESELGLRWLETRSGITSFSGSTDGERRSAKIRRLSNTSSVGSVTMLEEPRRKASPSKGFPLTGWNTTSLSEVGIVRCQYCDAQFRLGRNGRKGQADNVRKHIKSYHPERRPIPTHHPKTLVPNWEATPERKPMLQRYLDNLDRLEFLRDVSVS